MNPTRLLPLLLLLVCAACSNPKPQSADADATERYPLPRVPDTITDPARRASAICARFWDEARFPTPGNTDSVSPALEQALANFIAIAPLAAEPDSVSRGIATLLGKGGTDLIMPLAERYLQNGDSPLRSDEIFLLFLQAAPRWQRTPLLLPLLLQNRVGTPAADFDFTDLRGHHTTLGRFAAGRGQTLLYIFDPQCNHCRRLLPAITQAAQGSALLALCVADTTGLGDLLPLLPADATVATTTAPIDDLYHLPSLPAAYLLAPDLTVLSRTLPR